MFDSRDVVFVDYFSPDAVPYDELVKIAKDYRVSCHYGETPQQAVEMAVRIAKDRPVFATGSLYLAASLRQVVLEIGRAHV